MIYKSNLLKLCDTLNCLGVQYAVAGGYACALNGHVRMTEDIDILLKDEDENIVKTIEAIHRLFPHIKEDISISDIRENIVLKIVDEIEVDFSIKAWTVDYSEAEKDIKSIILEGVDIPFLGINALIHSKNTPREIDQWDIKILKKIQKMNQS